MDMNRSCPIRMHQEAYPFIVISVGAYMSSCLQKQVSAQAGPCMPSADYSMLT